MTDSLETTPESSLSEHLCPNGWYLWAVQLDHAYWLNGLTAAERKRHDAEVERLVWRWENPLPETRCTRCGEVAAELRMPAGKAYRCLERTCGHEWGASY